MKKILKQKVDKNKISNLLIYSKNNVNVIAFNKIMLNLIVFFFFLGKGNGISKKIK